tara:strand:+ start:145 stop:369 length:225 start_codon:yes stop_codon:yes gene_type:complete
MVYPMRVLQLKKNHCYTDRAKLKSKIFQTGLQQQQSLVMNNFEDILRDIITDEIALITFVSIITSFLTINILLA